MAEPHEDESLRRRALAALGSYAPSGARDALELGTLHREPDVVTWEGSQRTMTGHRVVLAVPPALLEAIARSHAVLDAVTAAVAASVSATPGQTLYGLVLRPRGDAVPPGASSPYRASGR